MTTGYDPNRDSGIAEARSYVEISHADLPDGLLDANPINPTQRVFAQLVYNVGATGQTDFNTAEVAKLRKLAANSEAILGIISLQLHTLDVIVPSANVSNTPDTDIKTTQNKLMAARYSTTTNDAELIYSNTNNSMGFILDDNDDFDGDTGTHDPSVYIININGYVSSVECYTWYNDERTVVSNVMDRFLPKVSYIPYEQLTDGYKLQYPYGRSVIYLTKTEYNYIAQFQAKNTTDKQYNIIRIHYLTIPPKSLAYAYGTGSPSGIFNDIVVEAPSGTN